ncbi:MAG: hypothetical protein MUC32_09090 [Burkholderiaceae bacterium]|nr:hypothetical protein [Burkholderiaceae bacterium]
MRGERDAQVGQPERLSAAVVADVEVAAAALDDDVGVEAVSDAHARRRALQPRRHGQRIELGVEREAARGARRRCVPLQRRPAQHGVERLHLTGRGTHLARRAAGVERDVERDVARLQPAAGARVAGLVARRHAPLPHAALPRAAGQRRRARGLRGGAWRPAAVAAQPQRRAAQRQARVEFERVRRPAAADAGAQAVEALLAARETGDIEHEFERVVGPPERVERRRPAPLRLRERHVLHAQPLHPHVAARAHVGPDAFAIEAGIDRAGGGQPGRERRVERRERPQRRQLRRTQHGAPRRRLARVADAGRGLEPVARHAVGDRQLGAAACGRERRRRRQRDIAVPAQREPVRAASQRVVIGAGPPDTRVETVEPAAARHAPGASGIAARRRRQLGLRGTAARVEARHVEPQPGAVELAVGVGDDTYRWRARQAAVAPGHAKRRLQGARAGGRSGRRVRRRQATRPQCERAAERQVGHAGVEACGAQVGQRGVERQAIALPAALAGPAPGRCTAAVEAGVEARQLDGAAVVEAPAQRQREARQRQAPLVPASRGSVRQRDVGLDRRVERTAAHVDAPAQPRARCAGREGREVEVAALRLQRDERPGRERRERRAQVGTRGRVGDVDARLDLQALQRPRRLEPARPRRLPVRRRFGVGVQRERQLAVGADLAARAQAQRLERDGELLHAVHRAAVGAELGAQAQRVERRQVVDLDALDLQVEQPGVQRQAQARGRAQRGGTGVAVGAAPLDAARPRLDEVDADPRLVVRPPVPAQIGPAQVVDDEPPGGAEPVHARRGERPAGERALRRADLQPRLRQKPGRAGRGADDPGRERRDRQRQPEHQQQERAQQRRAALGSLRTPRPRSGACARR